MDIVDLVGKKYDLYGADGNFFRLREVGKRRAQTYEAVEDEQDGYRSCLQGLREVTNPDALGDLVFSRRPVATAVGRRKNEAHDDIVELVDDSGHVWLEVGTENLDDYYPSFVCSWWPKAPG